MLNKVNKVVKVVRFSSNWYKFEEINFKREVPLSFLENFLICFPWANCIALLLHGFWFKRDVAHRRRFDPRPAQPNVHTSVVADCLGGYSHLSLSIRPFILKHRAAISWWRSCEKGGVNLDFMAFPKCCKCNLRRVMVGVALGSWAIICTCQRMYILWLRPNRISSKRYSNIYLFGFPRKKRISNNLLIRQFKNMDYSNVSLIQVSQTMDFYENSLIRPKKNFGTRALYSDPCYRQRASCGMDMYLDVTLKAWCDPIRL